MRIFILISFLILGACSSTKPINFQALHTDEDFNTAKTQIFKAFHKCKKVECTVQFIKDSDLLAKMLRQEDSTKLLLSNDEVDLTLLYFGLELQSGSFLKALQERAEKRDSILEYQRGKFFLNKISTYEEKVLAQKINFDYFCSILPYFESSREDKDFLELYVKILLAKYQANFRTTLYQKGELEAFDFGDNWLKPQKDAFFIKYPKSKYRSFIESVSSIQGH